MQSAVILHRRLGKLPLLIFISNCLLTFGRSRTCSAAFIPGNSQHSVWFLDAVELELNWPWTQWSTYRLGLLSVVPHSRLPIIMTGPERVMRSSVLPPIQGSADTALASRSQNACRLAMGLQRLSEDMLSAGNQIHQYHQGRRLRTTPERRSQKQKESGPPQLFQAPILELTNGQLLMLSQ